MMKCVLVCVFVFRWHGSEKEAASNQDEAIPASSRPLT